MEENFVWWRGSNNKSLRQITYYLLSQRRKELKWKYLLWLLLLNLFVLCGSVVIYI